MAQPSKSHFHQALPGKSHFQHNAVVTMSLYTLTMMCLERGGFRVTWRRNIKGVYHHPLAQLANELDIPAKVASKVDLSDVQEVVSNSGFVILSVDLAKLGTGVQGGHLLLVHDYIAESDEFVLHDCSSVVGNPGENARMTRTELAAISNDKGLIVSAE